LNNRHPVDPQLLPALDPPRRTLHGRP